MVANEPEPTLSELAASFVVAGPRQRHRIYPHLQRAVLADPAVADYLPLPWTLPASAPRVQVGSLKLLALRNRGDVQGLHEYVAAAPEGLTLSTAAGGAQRPGQRRARWQNQSTPREEVIVIRRQSPFTLHQNRSAKPASTLHQTRRSRSTLHPPPNRTAKPVSPFTKSHGEAGVHPSPFTLHPRSRPPRPGSATAASAS